MSWATFDLWPGGREYTSAGAPIDKSLHVPRVVIGLEQLVCHRAIKRVQSLCIRFHGVVKDWLLGENMDVELRLKVRGNVRVGIGEFGSRRKISFLYF